MFRVRFACQGCGGREGLRIVERYPLTLKIRENTPFFSQLQTTAKEEKSMYKKHNWSAIYNSFSL